LVKDGLSKTTIAYVHTLLRNVFQFALLRRKIPRDPMIGIKSPGGKQMRHEQKAGREDRTMTQEQITRFLQAAAATRFGALFTFAFYAGCRPCEALAARWSDLDSQARVIKIKHTIHWNPGENWRIDLVKSESGRRTIRLTDGLVTLMEQHRNGTV